MGQRPRRGKRRHGTFKRSELGEHCVRSEKKVKNKGKKRVHKKWEVQFSKGGYPNNADWEKTFQTKQGGGGGGVRKVVKRFSVKTAPRSQQNLETCPGIQIHQRVGQKWTSM